MSKQARSARKPLIQELEPAASIQAAYRLMRRHYGHLHWWPGETPFEVCVGAILTQNTNWANVAKAIANLKAAHLLEPQKLYALPEARLAQLIRPAGYFNVKARRLKAFLNSLVEAYQGDLVRFFAGPTPVVRQRLLEIKGIGPETADSMLLYAGGHCSFVIDAYTRRIFGRHGWCRQTASYTELQALCAATLTAKSADQLLDYWQDYHAQLVNIGKDYCRKSKPLCDLCPLGCLLAPGQQN